MRGDYTAFLFPPKSHWHKTIRNEHRLVSAGADAGGTGRGYAAFTPAEDPALPSAVPSPVACVSRFCAPSRIGVCSASFTLVTGERVHVHWDNTTAPSTPAVTGEECYGLRSPRADVPVR